MSYSTKVDLKSRDTSIQTPTSLITRHGRTAGAASIDSEQMGCFTGKVWLDPVMKGDDITVVHVNFQPGARTHWHRHEGGQMLKVTAGSGWVCDQGHAPQRIGVGDVIWCKPGGVHWHGADDGTFLVHEATSFGGLDWYEAVGEREYGAKTT